MSFKEKIAQYYTKSYLKKYGDRLTQVQGTVVSVKVSEKTILWIFNKITVTLLVRPERSKNVIKCVYLRNRWFKKPEFITVNQGNLVLVQGLKGKKGKGNSEQVEMINIRNMTTKKDLVPMEGKMQKVQKVQRMK
ncbi:hypothetical protein [Clostridium magnum]|uniref:Uncharacterized protein n=1 Tax=Clostridium magnum DSM 2767 TaxID=1121326 RepID=A0A162UPZ3_9CLOT|nr:hypothetical protein [Clostridium magnum]KZL94164.1 hypothetical protein CLMAG_12170 [Clostridium magnum DSM 2767]SHH93873.1 hypothetical protein SAMN02745944_01836 [Clostridium magnum DSM 2767]